MNKITYILFSLCILSAPLFSQSEVDALRFSREDIHGTARAMSMGGAFGALGGDQTGVSINPAGIAVYRSSEVVGTMNLSKEKSVVGSTDAGKNRFDMDNLGFVGYFPLRSDAMPLLNFGFSYNKMKSFYKDVNALGTSLSGNTMMDYMAWRSGGINPSNLKKGDDLPDPYKTQYEWLSVLGYNSSLIKEADQNGKQYNPLNTAGETALTEIRTYEKGYINNYDFTMGTTINNLLNLGVSISVKDVYYDLASDYLEDYKKDNNGYTLTNWLTVRGAGVGAKFGAIYRPVNSLRIGLSWHTPTWYALIEEYEAQIHHNMGAYVTNPNYESKREKSGAFRNSYDLKTPGKLVASVATVLGSKFIASVDYELQNYNKMKLSVPANSMDDPNWYDTDNEYISMDHKSASTVRLGMEYRITPQFSGRLGYAWMQNPYNEEFVKLGETYIPGSSTIHRMEGDTQYLTGGLGYRFDRNFYLDLAVVYKTRTDDLYPYSNFYDADSKLVVDAAPFSLKNNSVRSVLTLGYKF